MTTTATERGLLALRHHRRTPPPRAQSVDVETRLVARRRWVGSLRRRIAAADTLCTLAVVWFALAHDDVVAAGLAVAVLAVVTVHMYDASSPRGFVALAPVLRATTYLVGVACVVATFVTREPIGREIILGAGATALALVLIRCLAHLPRPAERLGFTPSRRMVVGDKQALSTTASRRAPLVASGEVIPVVTRAARPPQEPLPVSDQREADDGRAESGPTGLVERIVRTALDHRVERVTVIPGETWAPQQLRELSWLLEDTGIDMVIATELDGIAPHRVDIIQQEGRLDVQVGSANPRGVKLLVKELIDRVGSLVLLVLLAPVLLGLAAAVRINSAGPAFFHQTRVRAGGATFTMHKFRTMLVHAESDLVDLQEHNLHVADGPLFKMTDDPRVTRVGRLLRKTSLDELPQLLNVLMGEMSLIGPRPALPTEVEAYDYVARRRLAVKPGMTGLWQVSGRSRLSWDESIGFDLDYVDNWSPAADAVIAVRTIRAVVTRDGAY